MGDKLIGLKEVADRLSVSEFTVRRRVKEGTVRSVRLGRRLLIAESEVERIVREGCKSSASKSREMEVR